MFENFKNIICVIIECKIGYYWTNCGRKCPFPFYGEKCKEMCQCQEHNCDFANGCYQGKYIFNFSHKLGLILFKFCINIYYYFSMFIKST